MTMKTVVIGGSGFLGSYVVDELLRRGHEARIFDRVPSPYAPQGVPVQTGDILDAPAVEAAVKGAEVVYHFAGQADIGRSIENPLETIKTNVVGTTIVLDACRKHPPKRFVFASTTYVLSTSGGFYGASKHCCERLVREYSERFGLKYTILRYGSVYGERAGETNRIHRLLKDALTTGRVVFPGDGSEEREYIHAQDAARLSVDILAPEYENEHVLLTGVERFKYKDLLALLSEIMGGRVKIEYRHEDYVGHYKMTPYSFLPPVSRKLTSNPSLDFPQGLLHCLQHLHVKLTQDGVLSAHKEEKPAKASASPKAKRR